MAENEIQRQDRYSQDEIKRLNPAFYKKYVINLKSKDYMTYNGLIALGKAKGLIGMQCEVIQYPNASNDNTCIVKATLKGLEYVNGELREVIYTGIGDANVGNCNKTVGAHFIRMAETRAKGRALRDFTGIDMTMSDELCDGVFEETDPAKKAINADQVTVISDLMAKGGWTKESMQQFSLQACGSSNIKQYTMAMAEHLIKVMRSDMAKRGIQA